MYQGFGARDVRLLLSKTIRKFEDPPSQILTGVPITYKFSSFHWSTHNLQIFTRFPKSLWASWAIYFEIDIIDYTGMGFSKKQID